MRNLLLIMFFLGLLYIPSHADVFEYDLRDFTVPDYTSSSLTLSNGYSKWFYNREVTDPTFSLFFYNNGQSSNNYLSSSIAYSQDTYTRDFRTFILCNVSYSGNYSKNLNNTFKSDSDSSQFSTSTRYSMTSYLSNTFFWAISPQMSYSYRTYEMTEGDHPLYSTTIDTESFINYFGELTLGVGRLENVGYARTALFMYEDMKKYGMLTEDPTKEDIQELATLIAQRKNTRSYDYRDTYVKNVSLFDDFFKTKTNIRFDAPYYAAYTDVYQHSPHILRYFGSVFSLSFMLGQMNNTTVEEISPPGFPKFKTDHSKKEKYLTTLLQYIYANPISQKSQLYSTNYLEWKQTTIEDDAPDALNYKIARFRASSRNEYQYYPTQRTELIFGVSADIYNYDYNDFINAEEIDTRFGLILETIIGSSYYISPFLSISSRVGFVHFRDKQIQQNDAIFLSDVRNSWSFTLSCTYKIF